MRIGFGTGLFDAAMALPSLLPIAPTTVPIDWRTAATVTTSAGLSAQQSTLAAAQQSPASKARPAVPILAGATEYIEWTPLATGQVILSWLGQSDAVVTVARNGADLHFAVAAPSGSTIDGVSGVGGRRQFMRIAVAAGDTIRLTIAAGNAARTLRPLLHTLPASGPWDAHVVFGASREAQGLGCQLIEDTVIAAYPARDPIVFNFAVSGQTVLSVRANAEAASPIYAGVACHALLGSIIGNDVSNGRPYDSGEKAALDSEIARIATALSGYVLGFANTSYRQYPEAPAVTPQDQGNGAAPYNDAVIHPAIAAYAPKCYDPALRRSRIDTYLALLAGRAALAADGVHEGYAEDRANWVTSWFARVASGAWPASLIEQRVSAAEASARLKVVAMTNFTEAAYALAALEATAARGTLQARLDAIRPTALFFEAVRLIDVAVASAAPGDRSSAQAALNAAIAAGYAGSTAPDTNPAQQARIDAIAVSSFDQIVRIGLGASGAIAGWNRSSATSGTIFANLSDATGAATGISLANSATAPGSGSQAAPPSQMSDFADDVLDAFLYRSGGSFTLTLAGLDPARSYDLAFACCRITASANSSRVTVNGGTAMEVRSDNNVSNALVKTNVAPAANGQIAIQVGYNSGAGTSFGYLNGIVVKRHA